MVVVNSRVGPLLLFYSFHQLKHMCIKQVLGVDGIELFVDDDALW